MKKPHTIGNNLIHFQLKEFANFIQHICIYTAAVYIHCTYFIFPNISIQISWEHFHTLVLLTNNDDLQQRSDEEERW